MADTAHNIQKWHTLFWTRSNISRRGRRNAQHQKNTFLWYAQAFHGMTDNAHKQKERTALGTAQLFIARPTPPQTKNNLFGYAQESPCITNSGHKTIQATNALSWLCSSSPGHSRPRAQLKQQHTDLGTLKFPMAWPTLRTQKR